MKIKLRMRWNSSGVKKDEITSVCLLHHMQVLKLDVTSCLLGNTHRRTHTRKHANQSPMSSHLIYTKKNQGVSESCSHSRPSQFLPRTPSDWVLFLLFGSDLMSSPHRLHRLFPLVFCWVVCISTTGALFVHNCPPFTWNGSYIYINILKIIFMFVSTFCIFFLVMFIASGFKTCMWL